jgi:acyl carrier protein
MQKINMMERNHCDRYPDFDSFSLMDLALYVEDTFGVRIEDTELNATTFDNLKQLAGLITSRR